MSCGVALARAWCTRSCARWARSATVACSSTGGEAIATRIASSRRAAASAATAVRSGLAAMTLGGLSAGSTSMASRSAGMAATAEGAACALIDISSMPLRIKAGQSASRAWRCACMKSAALSSGRMFIRSSPLMVTATTAKATQMRLALWKIFCSIDRSNGSSRSMLRFNTGPLP